MTQFNNKYIICGVWNTVFGYLFGLFVYTELLGRLNFLVLSVGINIVCITMSYLTYKLIVFKTKDNWIREYIKIYLVYGVNAVLGIFGIWILYEKLLIPIWISQALIIFIVTLFSYFANLKFTFHRKRE